MKPLTKEQLQKQLREIQKQEERVLCEVHYPTLKKLEGKYFKYRNSHSCPEKPSDYWWIYTKVTEIKLEDLYMIGDEPHYYFTGWSFQTDKDGMVSVKSKENGFKHTLDIEITEAEFTKAWNKLTEKLNQLK